LKIELIEPVKGIVTRPLQEFPWPTDDGLPDDVSDDISVSREGPDLAQSRSPGVDRSFPLPVLFAWRSVGGAGADMAYDLHISRNRDFRDCRIVSALRETHAEVLHLHIATPYYWKVVARRNGEAAGESDVETFTTHPAAPRWIGVPGITNVRDIGGWQLPGRRHIRQGLSYRGSEMNGHMAVSDEGRRILMEDLGIRTDLDLRAPPEEVQPVLDRNLVEWLNVPLLPYARIGENAAQQGYRAVFETFADHARYPIFFHCWGGADRTGTVAFMLGALLGTSRQNLMRDYELTSLSIWGQRSRKSAEFRGLLAALARYDESRDIGRQTESYLLSAGLGERYIAQIRAMLIEPAPL
jgi:hypothetical protein